MISKGVSIKVVESGVCVVKVRIVLWKTAIPTITLSCKISYN